MTEAPLVEVEDLAPHLRRLEALAQPRARAASRGSMLKAVDGVSLRDRRGRDASRWSANPARGKSTVARLVVGLLPPDARRRRDRRRLDVHRRGPRASASACAGASR